VFKIGKNDVTTSPFPHVISSDFLDPEIYDALRSDFPNPDIFEEQQSEFGQKGSRTGHGFDIYRGDTAYSELIRGSDAWREFDAFINSSRFVEFFLSVFEDHLPLLGCRASLQPDLYDRELIEGREQLTSGASFGEQLSGFVRRFTPSGSLPVAENKMDNMKLFSRLDIHRAMEGYAKEVHCDRPNRLCSMILYFCDAEKSNFSGGDLTLHAHRQKKDPSKYERHPRAIDAPVVATVSPAENLGVFFPCCNNSYHGVTALTSHGGGRDYLYINISGDTKSL
jgi:2OG-Fe(II) oxygenase superfamily